MSKKKKKYQVKTVKENTKFNRKASHFKERFPGLDLATIKERMETVIESDCMYCNINITLDNCSADHRISTKNGGKNTEDNFAIICKKCNRSKAQFNEDCFTELLQTADQYGEKKTLLTLLARATSVFGRW
jgi:5-methylcytosine-specific restriction endonuclease McrA